MRLTDIYIVKYIRPTNYGYETQQTFFTTLPEARKETAKLIRVLRTKVKESEDDISISLYHNDDELGYWRSDGEKVVSYITK